MSCLQLLVYQHIGISKNLLSPGVWYIGMAFAGDLTGNLIIYYIMPSSGKGWNLGNLEKNLWPPLEDSAALPSEEQNPIIKLVMDVSISKETLLEDYVLLTNRFNIHRCSDYCLKK
jgi:hypothetical protein